MTECTINGLERLASEKKLQGLCEGNLAYLGHSPAVTHSFQLGLEVVLKLFGSRIIKAFGPQHGFVTDVQDNMVETNDFKHPYFNTVIHSLYGETRVPTDEMLEGVNTLLVDLQDVGTRVYTYITTLGLVMERCEKLGIKVIVLDRPNPVGGKIIEGPVLKKDWHSFVGHHPIPQRHGMTMGEVAHFQRKVYSPNCDLTVVQCLNWKRDYFWKDCKWPWVNPSPNLPTPESAITFCGTVLYEGTLISEGRGTTRSLEVLGHPKIEAFKFRDFLDGKLKDTDLKGFVIRPIQFHPMFQKYAGETCGGIHIHPTEPSKFKSWHLGAYLLRCFAEYLEDDFKWNDAPYEYQNKELAINFINGSPSLKEWVEKDGDFNTLKELAIEGHDEFLALREDCLIYN